MQFPLAAPARDAVLLSVVIPCLNEAESIGQCVITARRVLDEHGLDGEVVVVDNGSNDGSGDLAALAGARVVAEPRRGYGSAYLAGFAAARGRYIVMIDADLTYDFEEIPRFVRELDSGGDLVIGNRMQAVEPGAMSALSRIGNPLLSGSLREPGMSSMEPKWTSAVSGIFAASAFFTACIHAWPYSVGSES